MGWLTASEAICTGVARNKTLKMAYSVTGTSGTTTTYHVYETTTETTDEYRGLTEEAAKAIANADANNTDTRTFTDITLGVTKFIGLIVGGTKKTASASRANEANGWHAVVRTVETKTTCPEANVN